MIQGLNIRITDRIKSFIYWHFPVSKIELVHRVLNPDYIFNIKSYNKQIKMYLPCKHDYIQTEIIVSRQFYENTELAKIHDFIKPGMVILDVGANIGNHTVYFGSILEANKIYSFEPQKIPASICRKNIMLNKLDGIVELFEYGLGKDNSRAKIIFDGLAVDNIGGTMLTECENGDIDIRMLDDLHILEKIDFIKIDVEEMEASVLLGAKNTILRDYPTIWIEIMDKNYENVSSILDNYGYEKITELSGNNYVFMHRAAV